MDSRDVMRDYFLALDAAAKARDADGRPRVAWCTSVGPAEILRAFGFEVFFPENHGAMLGATRMCMDTMTVAHAAGYSPDICSYLTSDIGAFERRLTPLTRAYGIESIPRPDLLVFNTNQCKDVQHWFEYYAREFKAPIFGIHSPGHLVEAGPGEIRFVAGRFEELIRLCERITGAKLPDGRLEECLALSREATDLWAECLRTARHRPSPLSFFDGTIHMGPIVVLRGTPQARNFYAELLRFLTGQCERNEASVPGERLRIYWDGMPIWGRLRALSELFRGNRTCVVASTYCNSWIFDDFDPRDPLRSMASAYLKIFINRNDAYKESYIRQAVKEFSVDGVVFHDSKTCPNNSNSQYNLPARLRASGVPSVVINGDLCDLRCFSDEQSATVLEAFLETLR